VTAAGARPVLLRGEVPAYGVVAPILIERDGAARLVTDAPAPLGEQIELRIGWPGWVTVEEVTAEVVGALTAGAPGDRASWELVLAAGAARARLAALVAPAEVTAPRAAPVRVLLVEDSPLVADAFAWGLRRHLGARAELATVDVAATAAAGWDLVAAHDYELIIVDHYLPDETGAALIARLRRGGRALPPVIAVSRAAIAAAATLAAGADLFLAKPLALAELFSIVELSLAREPR